MITAPLDHHGHLDSVHDRALKVWSHGHRQIAITRIVSTPLGQEDHPELAGDALLSINDRTLLQAEQALKEAPKFVFYPAKLLCITPSSVC